MKIGVALDSFTKDIDLKTNVPNGCLVCFAIMHLSHRGNSLGIFLSTKPYFCNSLSSLSPMWLSFLCHRIFFSKLGSGLVWIVRALRFLLLGYISYPPFYPS